MTMFMLTLMLATLAPQHEEAIVRAAIEKCPRYCTQHGCQPATRLEPRIRELFEIERAAGVPAAVRGILAAAACWESAYRADPRGSNDGGLSRGIVQFRGCFRSEIRAYRYPWAKGDPRLDWRASARYWADRLVRYANVIVPRSCPKVRGLARWRTAAAKSVRGPGACLQRRKPKPDQAKGRCVKRRQRCGEVSHHWRVLEGWQAQVNTAGAP